MNPYTIGSDIIGADAIVTVQPAAKPNFLQKEAFGGMKVWQVGLGSLGLASILGGVIALVVKRK